MISNPKVRPALSLENISFSHKGELLFSIRNFNLLVPENKIFGLLGPNGAGKTTLIHIMCGLLPIQSGTIKINDAPIQTAKEFKKYIGLVPQYNGLFNELTLREKLSYFGKLHLLKKDTIHDRIELLYHALSLEHHLDKQIKFYSGGMNRRANIICGLIHDPELVILDEPTSGVDIHSRHIIHDLIADLKTGGKTIIYTSHLLDEAEKLCDTFCLIDNGSIIYSGDMKTIDKTTHFGSLQEMIISLTGKEVRD